MDILFICPFCEQEMSVDEAGIGEELPCPECGEQVIIQRCEPKAKSETSEPESKVSGSESSNANEKPAESEKAPDLSAGSTDPAKTGDSSEAKPAVDGKKSEDDAVTVKPVAGATKSSADASAADAAMAKAKEGLIKKPIAVLGSASDSKDGESSGPVVRIKSFRHHDSVDMGNDHFDSDVAKFLGKIDKKDIVSVSPISYSYLNPEGVNLHDFGILVIYNG